MILYSSNQENKKQVKNCIDLTRDYKKKFRYSYKTFQKIDHKMHKIKKYVFGIKLLHHDSFSKVSQQ